MACLEHVGGETSVEPGGLEPFLSCLRMCKFHFLKNLLAFIKDAGAEEDQKRSVIDAAQIMLSNAAETGKDS